MEIKAKALAINTESFVGANASQYSAAKAKSDGSAVQMNKPSVDFSASTGVDQVQKSSAVAQTSPAPKAQELSQKAGGDYDSMGKAIKYMFYGAIGVAGVGTVGAAVAGGAALGLSGPAIAVGAVVLGVVAVGATAVYIGKKFLSQLYR